ncbi:MAG: outer membrane beta-barrel protein [Nibricoccus sp.]
MKTNQLLCAALVTTALASTAFGARFYAQPSVVFAAMDNFENEMGYGLTVGASFAGKHLVEIEANRLDFTSKYSSQVTLETMPITLGYRYEFPIAQRLSGSIGVLAGMIHQEVEYPSYSYVWDGFGYTFVSTGRIRETAESFAAGFQAGVSYRLNDHFALTLGAKALRFGESELLEQGTLMALQLGLNCRF